jgi:DNA polymerase II small subunit/DNA polymerase delta subunit B
MQAFLSYLQSEGRTHKTEGGSDTIVRDATLEYLDTSDSFRVTDKRDLIQYATFYFKRLSMLRDHVMQQCKKRWETGGQHASLEQEMRAMKHGGGAKSLE